MGWIRDVGETDRPTVLGEQDYEDYKLPFVKTQYGVWDRRSGSLTICKNEEQRDRVVELEPDRWTPMKRHVSAWVQDV